MTPAERAVQVNSELDILRGLYLSALKDFNSCRDQNAELEVQFQKLENAHAAATQFFNKLENSIIECDVLFQTGGSTWAQDLANSAVNVLESVAIHYEKVRRESSRLKKPAPEASSNAYCAMQSAVSKFNSDQVQQIKERFRALNLPIRGFDNPTALATSKPSQSDSMAADQTQPGSPSKGWIYAIVVFFVFLLGVLIVLIANLPKLRQYNSEVVTVSAYVIMGILAAAAVFGMLRSYAHVTGEKFGIAVEAGGPAALLLVLAGGGLFYEYKMRPREFNLVIYFHLSGDQAAIASANGTFYLNHNKREPFNVADGVCYLNRIDQGLNGQEVRFSFNFPGFSSALVTNLIRLEPDARIYIPLTKDASTEKPIRDGGKEMSFTIAGKPFVLRSGRLMGDDTKTTEDILIPVFVKPEFGSQSEPIKLLHGRGTLFFAKSKDKFELPDGEKVNWYQIQTGGSKTGYIYNHNLIEDPSF